MKCCKCKRNIGLQRIFAGCMCEDCKRIIDFRKNNKQDIHYIKDNGMLEIKTYNDYLLKDWIEENGDGSFFHKQNAVLEVKIGTETYYLYNLKYIDVGYIQGIKSYQDDNNIFHKLESKETVLIPVDKPISIYIRNCGFKFKPSEKYTPDKRAKYKAVTLAGDGTITGYGKFEYAKSCDKNFSLKPVELQGGLDIGQESDQLENCFYNYCYNIYDPIIRFGRDYILSRVRGDAQRQFLLYHVETEYYHYDIDDGWGVSMGMKFLEEVSPKEILDMIERDGKREELELFWKKEGYDDYDTILDQFEKKFCSKK
jgi:hypothetical protein